MLRQYDPFFPFQPRKATAERPLGPISHDTRIIAAFDREFAMKCAWRGMTLVRHLAETPDNFLREESQLSPAEIQMVRRWFADRGMRRGEELQEQIRALRNDVANTAGNDPHRARKRLIELGISP